RLSHLSRHRAHGALLSFPTRRSSDLGPDQRPFVRSAKRKCLPLYFYFMDRRFGLIHVRVQTWFPMPIQIYLNGHEWLARKLAAKDRKSTRLNSSHVAISYAVFCLKKK